MDPITVRFTSDGMVVERGPGGINPRAAPAWLEALVVFFVGLTAACITWAAVQAFLAYEWTCPSCCLIPRDIPHRTTVSLATIGSVLVSFALVLAGLRLKKAPILNFVFFWVKRNPSYVSLFVVRAVLSGWSPSPWVVLGNSLLWMLIPPFLDLHVMLARHPGYFRPVYACLVLGAFATYYLVAGADQVCGGKSKSVPTALLNGCSKASYAGAAMLFLVKVKRPRMRNPLVTFSPMARFHHDWGIGRASRVSVTENRVPTMSLFYSSDYFKVLSEGKNAAEIDRLVSQGARRVVLKPISKWLGVFTGFWIFAFGVTIGADAVVILVSFRVQGGCIVRAEWSTVLQKYLALGWTVLGMAFLLVVGVIVFKASAFREVFAYHRFWVRRNFTLPVITLLHFATLSALQKSFNFGALSVCLMYTVLLPWSDIASVAFRWVHKWFPYDSIAMGSILLNIGAYYIDNAIAVTHFACTPKAAPKLGGTIGHVLSVAASFLYAARLLKATAMCGRKMLFPLLPTLKYDPTERMIWPEKTKKMSERVMGVEVTVL